MRSLALIVALVAAPAHGQEALFGPDGYRIAWYRAPARQPPDGVVRIAPAAAAQLRPGIDALFLDVLPAEGGHRGADGRWTLAKPRESIPGAHWFPESGRGVPDADIAAALRRGVAQLTRRRRDMPIIVFCLADCWMSWNAAKRLRAAGYARVWWLAEGTDGWRDLGLPLEPVIPQGGIAR